MNSVKENLLQLIELVSHEFEIFPWEDRHSYANWLAQTYYYVRHTTCFLALTASRWGIKNRQQQYRALAHLKEESSHDLLLINDLKSLGLSIDSLSESPITQAFYQTQYYWIEHETPAAHLGYAYLLEGMASKKAAGACQKIAGSHGKGTDSFLKVHAEEDVGHFTEGLKNLDHFNSYELKCFLESAKQSAILYCQILKEAKAKQRA